MPPLYPCGFCLFCSLLFCCRPRPCPSLSDSGARVRVCSAHSNADTARTHSLTPPCTEYAVVAMQRIERAEEGKSRPLRRGGARWVVGPSRSTELRLPYRSSFVFGKTELKLPPNRRTTSTGRQAGRLTGLSTSACITSAAERERERERERAEAGALFRFVLHYTTHSLTPIPCSMLVVVARSLARVRST